MQWLRYYDSDGHVVLLNLDQVRVIQSVGNPSEPQFDAWFDDDTHASFSQAEVVEVFNDVAELSIQLTGEDPSDPGRGS